MDKKFWPDGARLVISISMQFEAGAQPDRGAYSPYGDFDPGLPNPAIDKWFQYGVKEGLPRLLDLWDRKNIKVTSHMVGKAVEASPALAREIVERGHEAAGHGYEWVPHHRMTPDEERASYKDGADIIERVTGTRPVGFNAFALRGTENTLGILKDLGYIYHIDDISRDEPFLVNVNGGPFCVVPYTRRNNDIERFHTPATTVAAWLGDLKEEFDQLYEEAGHRRRLMSVSTHDRIGGQPAPTRALGRFIDYAQSHPGVVFMRKDDIARFALEDPDTIRE